MATRTHDGKGRFIRTAASARRDAQAAALRAQGWTFRRIAVELGYVNAGRAHDGVRRAFADIPHEDVDAARQLDLERIDRLIEQAWAVMTRPHFAVSGGQVVTRLAGTEPDENGAQRPVYEELMDDGPILAAVAHIRALLERRAKITGYDAPAQARIEVITTGMIEAEIQRLEAEVGDRAAADSGSA